MFISNCLFSIFIVEMVFLGFMKKIFLLIIALFFVWFIFILNWPFFLRDGQYLNLELKDHLFAEPQKTVKVRVVKKEENIRQGLSDREYLSDGEKEEIEGMLFILPSKRIANFWMKDMNFDIDICWIKSKVLIACEREAKAEEIDPKTNELKLFNSKLPVSMVLETNPSFIEDQQFASLFPQKSIFFLF